ncbi:non-heme iron oxygenase ferredoxin subunit [Haematomicrobium sanguinis]|uniref:non-heme iron oxygenase ferredoxin subunit n=1 Tax=Haematomicrobium sanguinis TaxID=479106 RepID=UPI00047BA472|nr:non-heme iron oxygenase ferredoxin subunit [Haematomicrobium sanguinis]
MSAESAADASARGTLVCQVNDLSPKQALRILVDDYPVAVVKDSMGNIYAIGDTCSHEDVSLAEGDVAGCTIECWGHGSQFDLRTGEPLSLPAFEPVPTFALTVDGTDVYVDVDTITNGAPKTYY